MSASTRHRLASIVRQPDCDLAEAALLLCTEVHPELDVAGELLRIDAIADSLRTTGFSRGTPRQDAEGLAQGLAGRLGFTGATDPYYDPRNGLLTDVLDSKRGLPILLSILYVAVGRRLHVPAFGIGLPGHFVTGIGGADRPVVIDPFQDGRIVEEAELSQRVQQATGGRTEFRRAMLRPASPAGVIRRVLNNLTRDFTNQGDVEDALWTVELKLLLPSATPDDHRVRGELLHRIGRFRDAAEAFEAYVEVAGGGAPDAAEVSRRAIRSRAKLN